MNSCWHAVLLFQTLFQMTLRQARLITCLAVSAVTGQDDKDDEADLRKCVGQLEALELATKGILVQAASKEKKN